jgi:DNA-binding transcriptional regulator YhcF (GntR family)
MSFGESAIRDAASATRKRGETGQALVDELAQRIQLQIMSGELPLGTHLRQETLAEAFGVSRTPIREALRQLQAKGMLEIFPRRGAAVRGPSPRDIREAYMVRAELEGLAAQLAAELITDGELGQLRDAAAMFAEAVAHVTAPGDGSRALSDAEWPSANGPASASGVPAELDMVRAEPELSTAEGKRNRTRRDPACDRGAPARHRSARNATPHCARWGACDCPF